MKQYLNANRIARVLILCGILSSASIAAPIVVDVGNGGGYPCQAQIYHKDAGSLQYKVDYVNDTDYSGTLSGTQNGQIVYSPLYQKGNCGSGLLSSGVRSIGVGSGTSGCQDDMNNCKVQYIYGSGSAHSENANDVAIAYGYDDTSVCSSKTRGRVDWWTSAPTTQMCSEGYREDH